MKKCNELKIKNITIKGDSELVIKQLTKEYNVNSPNLITLNTSVINELYNFHTFNFIHIPRNKNKEADKLANEAIDEYLSSKHEHLETDTYSIG